MPRFLQRLAGIFLPLLVLALSACGGPPQRVVGQSAPLECVPFARALSGVNLHGDAGSWWWQANGRYAKGRTPEVGSVLTMAPARGLPRGHVAVVSQVLSQREILVTQANWVRHRITTDQLVVDVSPYSDWSLVRVWWPPTNALGNSAYPTFGFIYSGYATSHERIVQTVPGAVRLALRG